MDTVSRLCFTIAILTNIYTDTRRLTTGSISLIENVDTLYGYMGFLASHLVNPFIVPPNDL